jgi:hypothetical protein
LEVACSGAGEAEVSDDTELAGEQVTAPRLVDNFEPDPSMFFGDSEEEQARARAALGEGFFEADEGELVDKRVNTSACLEFTVPPFVGPPGDIQFFSNTLPPGGLAPPTNTCGFNTIGESRRVFIQNFSLITRPGSGTISVGVSNASVAECADLRVALAVAEDRGSGQSTRVLFRSDDVPAQLQQTSTGAVCASFIPMFGSFESERFEGKDLWIAVLARINGQNINNRVHVIRQSDLQ